MTQSTCRKVERKSCVRKSKCMYANGSQRKYCRKTGKHTCRGKLHSECVRLKKKCLFTKGKRTYCRKRRTYKKRA